MAFYRHFVERKDFQLRVVTNRPLSNPGDVPYRAVHFESPAVLRRLSRTRLLPWVSTPQMLVPCGMLPKSVWSVALEFKPDAIFTIAGTWDWSALVAERVARKLKIPLIASFNDWFNFGWFPPHPLMHGMIEKRFRRYYREADLSLCTCEGMREELGDHRNAHILYPIGASIQHGINPFIPSDRTKRPFVVAFAGSMAGWYGKMLESLTTAAWRQDAAIEFRFYGNNCGWSRGFDEEVRHRGIFRGQIPFSELSNAMREVDALILPMGFEMEAALVERTSFKTKFLDYLTYQKPIIVWGPQYCSAVRVAREFDSAEVCTDPDPLCAINSILSVAGSPSRQVYLVERAMHMYLDRFHPDRIHQDLVAKIQSLIEDWSAR